MTKTFHLIASSALCKASVPGLLGGRWRGGDGRLNSRPFGSLCQTSTTGLARMQDEVEGFNFERYFSNLCTNQVLSNPSPEGYLEMFYPGRGWDSSLRCVDPNFLSCCSFLCLMVVHQMVRMLTYLLEQYYQNTEKTNHFIVAFFQRMRAFDLEKFSRRRGRRGRWDDSDEEGEVSQPNGRQAMEVVSVRGGEQQSCLDGERGTLWLG